jgi:hypothetical protein
VAQPALPSDAGGGAAANADAHPQPHAGSQDNCNSKLLLLQLDRLHLAFTRSQVSPLVSSTSQDQQSQHLPKSVIPTHRRVTEQRPHKHLYRSLRCNKGARLDGKRARAVVSYGRTLGQNTARRHGQRRSTAWRCGGEELPEGSSWESKLSL